jgi:hypothetical protein
MQYICRHFSPCTPEALGADGSEDLFFSYHLKHCWKANLPPSPHIASDFGLEYSDCNDAPTRPMGFHQFYSYHDRRIVAQLLTNPPVQHDKLIDIKDAWISAGGMRYYHPRLIKWLRTGVSHITGFTYPEGTRIPFAHDIAPGSPKTLVVVFTDGTHQIKCIP